MEKKNLYTDEKNTEKRDGNFNDLFDDINSTLDSPIANSVNKLIGKSHNENSKKTDLKEEFEDIFEMLNINEKDKNSREEPVDHSIQGNPVEEKNSTDKNHSETIMNDEFFSSLLDEVNSNHYDEGAGTKTDASETHTKLSTEDLLKELSGIDSESDNVITNDNISPYDSVTMADEVIGNKKLPYKKEEPQLEDTREISFDRVNTFDEILKEKSTFKTRHQQIPENIRLDKPEKEEKLADTKKRETVTKVKMNPVPERENINLNESSRLKNEENTHSLKDENKIKEIKEEARKRNQKKENKDDLDLLKVFGVPEGEDFDEEDLIEKIDSRNKSKPEKTSKSLNSLYRTSENEYTSGEQNQEILTNYQKNYYNEIIKFCVSTICFLLLLYLEIAPYLKWGLPPVLNINYYNIIYIYIDVQLLLIVGALNYKSILYGIKSVLSSVINIYYISLVFFVLNLFFTITTYFLRYNNPQMMLFNSISVLFMLMISVYNILDINAEILSFKVISSKKEKYTIITSSSADEEMEEFRYIIPEDSIVGKIKKSRFVSGFFSNVNNQKNTGGIEKYILSIGFVISFVVFTILLALKTDLYVALSFFMVILLSSVPLCSALVNIVPWYKAQRKAYLANAALIGMQSIEKYSEAQIISLYDRDIFPSENIKISGIKVYGNNRIDVVLQYLCTVFEKLNLTLTDVFKLSMKNYNLNFSLDVRILGVDENGISFVSNGGKFYIGNNEYFRDFGLTLPFDKTFDEQFEKSSGSIMYFSTDNEIISKIYVKYEIISDFYDIIKGLSNANICLAIKTLDPNINNHLIAKLVNHNKTPIKVIKIKSPEETYRVEEKINSAVISKANLKSLIHTFLLSSKTQNTMRSNVLIQGIAFITGLVLTTLYIFMGVLNSNPTMFNAGQIFLFQLFWNIPVIFLSSMTPF